VLDDIIELIVELEVDVDIVVGTEDEGTLETELMVVAEGLRDDGADSTSPSPNPAFTLELEMVRIDAPL